MKFHTEWSPEIKDGLYSIRPVTLIVNPAVATAAEVHC